MLLSEVTTGVHVAAWGGGREGGLRGSRYEVSRFSLIAAG